MAAAASGRESSRSVTMAAVAVGETRPLCFGGVSCRPREAIQRGAATKWFWLGLYFSVVMAPADFKVNHRAGRQL